MEDQKPRYLYYNLNVLRALTILPVSAENAIYRKLYQTWYFSWRFLCLFAILYVLICTSIELYLRRTADIITKSTAIVNISMYVALSIRISYFWCVEKKTKNLIDLMFTTFRNRSTTGLTEEIDMKTYIDFSNTVYLVWFATAMSGGELHTLIEIFVSDNREIPMPTWHPYDPKKTPYYQLTCLLQIISQAVMVLLMNGTDTFWSLLAYITSAQFRLLAYEFENVCYTALIRTGVSPRLVEDFKNSLAVSKGKLCSANKGFEESDELFEGICEILQSERYNDVLNQELIRLVELQKGLLNFCEVMDSYWSGILLPMVLITQTYTTFSGFVLLLSRNVTDAFRILQYIIPMLLEIGFLTYSGQLLANESETIQLAMYKTPWYLCGKKFRNLLKMAHFRAKKPVVITMAKFAAVDLKAYTYLMKSSMSYLAVLNKMRNH